jgi:Fe2+ or Zn2+ uptake regulation protein
MLPSSEELAKNWLDELRVSGYRITSARQAVVEILAGSRRTLTANRIYDLARENHPELGLVTVYRTLERLESLGAIQRVHLEGGCHSYIAAPHGHQHLLICQLCGWVEYFEGDDLQPLMDNLGKQLNFSVRNHWLELFGVCPACKEAIR